MINKKAIIYVSLWAFAIVASCTDLALSSQSPTVSPSLLPSKTVVPDPTLIATNQGEQPTLKPQQVTRLIRLLQSDFCNLPCYLGITPGQTNWDEAQKNLEDLGAFFSFETYADGLTIHNYHLDLGDQSLAGLTPDPNALITDVKIIQSIHIIVLDGIVQKLWTGVSTRRFVSEFREYWSRYSLWELLSSLGVPDQILMSRTTLGGTGINIILIYEEKGIVAILWDSISDNRFCPEEEKNSADLKLVITSISSQLSLFEPGTVLPTNREVYLPIEEIIEIDKLEFHNELVSDPSTCFNLKAP